MLKIAWDTNYNHDLPPKHRFPMEKYDLIPEQLQHEGTIKAENLFTPRILTENEITAVHTNDYWYRLKNLQLDRRQERATGFPLTGGLVHREIIINGGTIQAAEYALKHGVAMNIAGGTHHAFTDRGEGFCLLNDIAIAARYLLDNQLVQQVLVVDLDVHQGNGTAEIFEHDDRVFTFSIHGANNYPLRKETSNRDIPLPDKTDDGTYLRLLDWHLKELVNTVMPDFIFFQSGVDVLATDKLGRLGLSIKGCKSRDLMVIETAHLNEIPVTIVMGGGYSEDIRDIIEAHANTFRLAQEIYF